LVDVPEDASEKRLVIYCQKTGVSAAHATRCATYCTPCRPLIRAFPRWIRTPPPTREREEIRIDRQSVDALLADTLLIQELEGFRVRAGAVSAKERILRLGHISPVCQVWGSLAVALRVALDACEDRSGTGPHRRRSQVVYVDHKSFM